MIKRIVERYCSKQVDKINRLQNYNLDGCLIGSRYKETYGYHKRKRKIMIATVKHNTAIDLFLRDSKFEKIEVEL